MSISEEWLTSSINRCLNQVWWIAPWKCLSLFSINYKWSLDDSQIQTITKSWTVAESQVSKSNPVSKWCSSTCSIHWNLKTPKIPYPHKTFSGQGQRSGLLPCILSQSDHPTTEGGHIGSSSTSWLAEEVHTNHGFCEKLGSLYLSGIFSFRKPGPSLKFYNALSCCTELFTNGLIASDSGDYVNIYEKLGIQE